MDEVVWGECVGYNLGYCFGEIKEETDCLILYQSEDQIDFCFFNREEFERNKQEEYKHSGCWRIK